MGKGTAKNKNSEVKQPSTSWSGLTTKFNKLAQSYAAYLPVDNIFSAFMRTGYAMENFAPVQNNRIKAISSLPVDYSKEEIGAFLRNPYNSEQPLRQTSEILRWTAYPYFKVAKTYQDIPTYRYYTKPLYIDKETAQSDIFKREAVLLDKINKAMKPNAYAHKITGQAVNEGKIFYHLRVDIDKVHNKVNYAFMQQLPSDWCQIIGFNNISGYTVSFNLMYFMQMGTDYRQFGDLFEPYMYDFYGIFDEIKDRVPSKKFVYASKDGKQFYPNLSKVNAEGYGTPKAFIQDGKCMYYVSLPIDKIWTFEIDDTTTAVAPSLSGLMLTYSQQSDYEAAQLSLLLNPLIKIFTGEIPYRDESGATTEDSYKLSVGGRAMFEAFFNQLMQSNNTGGTAFYSGPFENIKSHDFSESANANEISQSFIEYSTAKAGLGAIIPASNKDVKASQVESSQKLEAKFTQVVIWQFERMMNSLYKQLNLNYDWEFKMFGDIYSDKEVREFCEKAIARGDLSAYFKLSALDEESWIDKISMIHTIDTSGLNNLLKVPPNANTQSGKEIGRPQTERLSSDAKEKAKDSGVGEK